MKKQSLYTERFETGNRKFYFDILETERGNNFLKINQVTAKENEDNQYNSIAVFESEVDQFSAALVRTLLHFNIKAKTELQPEARTARIQESKTSYSRAYEPWSKKEDAKLALWFSQGITKTEIVAGF